MARSPAVFVAVAAVSAAMAFVGLSASGYWTDELFTLFVIGHRGGLAEVMSRALTDTHPPGYYFLLYGWTRAFGLSEPATRLFSAACAVAAAGVFFFGLRRVFSPEARGFALALGMTSIFWFDQAQNARSYSLCMLVSAVLLALAIQARRAAAEGRAVPWAVVGGLIAAGFVGGFAHSYAFLEVGLVYLFLLVAVRSMRLRIALVVGGGAIAGLYLAYARMLLGHTLQDVHHMWFRNDPVFFFNQVTTAWRVSFQISGIVAAVALGLSAWVRRRRPDLPPLGEVSAQPTKGAPERGARWSPLRRSAPPPPGGEDHAVGEQRFVLRLSVFVHLGMIVLGIAVSLAVAPSMSSQNLATAAPLLWAILAWLYEKGAPRTGRGWDVALAAGLLLVTALHLPILAGRFLVRTEDWRGSASYVAGLPGCAGQDIPVVLPERFGPPTPFFRALAERYFYGRYYTPSDRLHAWLPDELTGRKPAPGAEALAGGRARSACPVLAWGVHDLEPDQARALAADLARRPGVAPARVKLLQFRHWGHEEVGYAPWANAFVLLAEPAAQPTH